MKWPGHINAVACMHVLDYLASIPDGVVQTCITSPPYWALRDYETTPVVWDGLPGCEHEWEEAASGGFCVRCGAWLGELGLEPTPQLYVDHLVAIFAEVHRTLRDDGSLWLNLGDCYIGYKGSHYGQARGNYPAQTLVASEGKRIDVATPQTSGLKNKNLVGMPWRVAFALQDYGWYLRREIIWHKPDPKPESINDRPVSAHEYVFLLSKSDRYQYNSDAVRVPYSAGSLGRYKYTMRGTAPTSSQPGGDADRSIREAGIREPNPAGRHIRSVWTISTVTESYGHSAVMPEDLANPCLLAGSEEDDIVMDPFAGVGTVPVRAKVLKRRVLANDADPGSAATTRTRLTQEELAV